MRLENEMSSYDRRINIERYPCYNRRGRLIGYSYGALVADGSRMKDLMGYADLEQLLWDVRSKLLRSWRVKK